MAGQAVILSRGAGLELVLTSSDAGRFFAYLRRTTIGGDLLAAASASRCYVESAVNVDGAEHWAIHLGAAHFCLRTDELPQVRAFLGASA